jgi:hypothetical protein
MASDREPLNCSEFDGGEVPDTRAGAYRQLQHGKSNSGAEDRGPRALSGMTACQRDRYKKVAPNRRCFGSGSLAEFTLPVPRSAYRRVNFWTASCAACCSMRAVAVGTCSRFPATLIRAGSVVTSRPVRPS